MESGIHLLPMVIALVVSSIVSGILTSRIGYYTPFLIWGICVAAVGAGLLTALQVNTSAGKWIGYQIVYGFGLGSCFQAPSMAAQAVLPRKEVSVGASLMLFAQTLFGAIFVSVGQNVVDGQLSRRLARVLSITPQQIASAGVNGLFKKIPPRDYDVAKVAYNDSLRVCFQVALVLACVCIFGGLCMEWRSVKKDTGRPKEEQDIEEGKDQGYSKTDKSDDVVEAEKNASST